MAQYNLKLANSPFSAFSSPTSWYETREGLKKQMNKRWIEYKDQIENAYTLANFPAVIIFSFMMIESGGNTEIANAVESTPGLMQINKSYIYANIQDEKNSDRMTAEEEAFLNTYGLYLTKSGDKYVLTGDPITKTTSGGITRRVIAKSTMIKTKLNIYLGALLLGQLFDKMTQKMNYADVSIPDNARKLMSLITVNYNAGSTAFAGYEKKGILNLSYSEIASASYIPSTTRTYIKKLIGTNGAMDVAMNDLGIEY